MDINKYERIDNEVAELKGFPLIKFLEAKNARQEKKKFLKGKTDDPSFVYKKPNKDLQKYRKKINSLIKRLPKDDVGNLYKEKLKDVLLTVNILDNLGKEKEIRELCKKKYGYPNEKLVKIAKKNLKKISKKSTKRTYKNLSADDVKKQVDDYLKRVGLTNWKTVKKDQHSVSVSSMKREIRISKLKKYSQINVRHLIAHEIDVHAMRTENGYRQPIGILSRGLEGFLPTADGLAVYFEKKKKVMSMTREKEINLRVLAVHYAGCGSSFRQVYDQMKKYIRDTNKCWEITYRVFRGGGFFKDHVYLMGYEMVKEYFNKGGKLEDLYVGRIGLKHVKTCKKLLRKGVLKPPKFLPEI